MQDPAASASLGHTLRAQVCSDLMVEAACGISTSAIDLEVLWFYRLLPNELQMCSLEPEFRTDTTHLQMSNPITRLRSGRAIAGSF
jgi:hypothetical protein